MFTPIDFPDPASVAHAELTAQMLHLLLDKLESAQKLAHKLAIRDETLSADMLLLAAIIADAVHDHSIKGYRDHFARSVDQYYEETKA